jgi:hypothetical protein
MRKEIKIAIVVFVIIATIINSRRVSKDKLEMMIFAQLSDISEKCNKRAKLKITKKLDYNDPLYNHYIDNSFKYKDFCNLSIDSMHSIVKKDIEKFYKKEWKFIY